MMNKKRLLALLLAVVMVVGMIPTVMAADGDTAIAEINEVNNPSPVTSKNGLVLSKTVAKTNNGYTLTLEAYAEGETITNQFIKPADIVAVIDQSGSMLRPVDDSLKLTKDYFTNSNDTIKANASHGLYYLAYGNSTVCFIFYQDGKWMYYDTYLLKNAVKHCTTCGKPDPSSEYPSNSLCKCSSPTLTSSTYCKYSTTDETLRKSGGWDNYVPDLSTIKSSLREISDDLWSTFEKNGMWQTRYGATYDALKGFASNVEASGVDHRIAIVGFGGYNETGTALYDGSTRTHVDSVNSTIAEAGLNSVKTDYITVVASIDALHTNQKQTYCYGGLTIANKIFDATQNVDRDKIAIVFSDGADANQSKALEQANILKGTYGVKVYSIAAASATPEFLNKVSSNYAAGTGSSVGSKVEDKYYFGTSSADALMEAFRQISEDVSSTTVSYDESTILRDIIADSFKLPSNVTEADKSAIEVYTQNYLGNGSFANEVAYDGTVNLKKSVNNINYFDMIEVSGFSFKDEFVAEAGAAGSVARGRKLVVKIPIETKPDFLGGNGVPTNENTSGIYSDSIEICPFAIPSVDIQVKKITPEVQDGYIYVSQLAELPHVVNLGKYTVNGTLYTVDGINNAYVNIEYTIKDGETVVGIYEIYNGTTDLAEGRWSWASGYQTTQALTGNKTYTVTCDVVSKNNENNKSNEAASATIYVYKPEITFKDSSIDLGTTADYETQNYESVFWSNDAITDKMKSLSEDEKNALQSVISAKLGKPPILTYTYNPPEGNFTSDTKVSVTGVKSNTPKNDGVVDPEFKHRLSSETPEIISHVTFKHETCGVAGCPFNAAECQFIVHVNKFDLTIIKEIDNKINPDQSFMFHVSGNGLNMDVLIKTADFANGTASITIKDLVPGDYTVTELTDWSWRYTCTDAEQEVLASNVTNGAASVTFTNNRTENKWLSGDSWAKNVFNGSQASKGN